MTGFEIGTTIFANEPFVLATQVQQVYYMDDYNRKGNWKVVEKVIHRHIWDIPSATSNDDDDEEEIFINKDAYQEEASNDIHAIFYDADEEISLVREEVPSTEIDALSIDLQISPDYRDPYDSEMDESDEDALLGDFELEDSKSITDESDESD